ncbi:protein pygopus-like [Pollicipes pollicipes]|uniref:protein pygopus-like n=1 Tax=Pollicipes pollicipes TaxID=41117 RepID=UPI0018859FC2|nr:protein pygopus-like [Pollicipes pollicipes]
MGPDPRHGGPMGRQMGMMMVPNGPMMGGPMQAGFGGPMAMGGGPAGQVMVPGGQQMGPRPQLMRGQSPNMNMAVMGGDPMAFGPGGPQPMMNNNGATPGMYVHKGGPMAAP